MRGGELAYLSVRLNVPNPSFLIDGTRRELGAGAVPGHGMDLLDGERIESVERRN